jgi:hypothetical protein
LKTNSTGNHYREKIIEKTILRILASCTFSHSLEQERTWVAPATTITIIGHKMGEPQLGATGALLASRFLLRWGYPLLGAADEINPP